MRTHTQEFKDNIKKFGRELDSIITYNSNGETIELGNSQLNSVSLNYEGKILKSVMKELKIDSNIEIPLETILNYKFGTKVNNEYEYIDYGNFIVYSIEKKEDTNSYEITCYDKILYFMKDYEKLNITYPIAIRSYISELCNKFGLVFANRGEKFANYNKRIPYELYLTTDGESLGYTFRDVLDELAQVTASTICINENDELEIRYINDLKNTNEVEGQTITIDNLLEKNNVDLKILGNTIDGNGSTGLQNIIISNGEENNNYEINLGKNLFDKDNATILNAYIGNTTIASDNNNRTTYCKCLPNKTYTISRQAGARFKVAYTYETPTLNSNIYGSIQNNNASSITITTNSQAQYLVVWYYNSNDIISANDILNTIQIEESSTATNYSSYFDPIELKENEYIYKSNNNWYVLKENSSPIQITAEELIQQLNNVRFFTGVNNISTSGNIPISLKIKYIVGRETINEQFLKDINVNFKEKFGPVNSIVLSRSAGTDNVYLKDKQSIEENGLCELKIVDNQIMNFNNRSDYLPDILSKLDGLEYYINDFSSTGIAYLDLCDKYNIQIDNITYPCIMFNDEINVTQGLEEIIYTKMPEEAETDYTKADKTDRRITQTYLIVDKQNKLIEATVQEVTEQNEKISTLEQTLDKFGSKIQDIADLTVSAESMRATLSFEKINSSQPLNIIVKPTPVDHIAYKYPHNTQYPNSELFGSLRIIKIENLDTDEVWQYEIPDDLYYYDEDNYDSFVLDYDNQKCYINKRCYMDNNGQVQLYSALHPDWEVYPSNNLFPRDYVAIVEYEYPTIWLTDGDYKISIVGYDTGYLYARLMKQNKYTTQFATTAELNSAINQTAEEIKLEVSHKVDEDEVASYFDITAESITAKTGKFAIDADNFKLEEDGTVTATKGTISKFEFDDDKLTVELTLPYDYTEDDVTRVQGIIAGTIQPTYEDYDKYDFIQNGNIDSVDLEIVQKLADGTYSKTSTYTLDTTNPIKALSIENGSTNTNIGAYSSYIDTLISDYINVNNLEMTDYSNSATIEMKADDGSIKCVSLTQTSLAKIKKNFEKFENGLEIIKGIDIYKYNLKDDENGDKKHIGLVIGDDFKYSKDVTSKNNDSVDVYSLVSVCVQAIKELNAKVEYLENKLKKESD